MKRLVSGWGALLFLGLAACGDDGEASSAAATSGAGTGPGGATTSSAGPGSGAGSSTTTGAGGSGGAGSGGSGGSGGAGGGSGGPVDPPVVCEGQCTYVRPGAAGDGSGSDWENALPGIPEELERGRVYLLADGDYGGLTIDDPTSESATIEIRKATVADHGTDAGWSLDFGDGVALFSGVGLLTSDLVFTGTRGGGAGAWATGHGIEIERTGTECRDNGALLDLGPGVSNVTVRHVHAHAANYDMPMNGVKGTGGASRLTFSYNSIHTTFGPTFHIGDWSEILIENNHLADVRSTGGDDPFCPDWHAEGISSIGTNHDVTIRFNLWDAIGGTAVIAGVNGGASTSWKIHGNTFARSQTTIAYYNEPNTSNLQSMDDLEFYNNAIVRMPGSSVGTILIQEGAGNRVWNNIWFDNVANTFAFQGVSHDHNLFAENRRVEGCDPVCDKDEEGAAGEANGQIGSGSPFVDAGGAPTEADFHLVAPTEPGATLPAPFDVDPEGLPRGADGVWDRGVFEHVR